MTDCDGCAKLRLIDNVVPYGEDFVAEELSECADGYDDDCPPEAFVPAEPHYAARSYGMDFSPEELEWGDMAGDMAREDGR